MCWGTQMTYESRYVTHDYFHRALDVFRYLCVGMAIFNITPLYLYANPESDNVMVFTLAMLLELMVTMGVELEVYYRALGDKICIQNHTLDNFWFKNGFTFMIYLAAFVLATVQYVQARSAAEHGEVIHSMIDKEGTRLLNTSAAANIHHHDAKWVMNDLPMTLTAAVYFLRMVSESVRVLWRRNKSIRDYYVPHNVDYVIHRCGEFIMLMMGEGILSLMIGKKCDVTFSCTCYTSVLSSSNCISSTQLKQSKAKNIT